MKNVLIIFIRNPELGKVKTRLARTMGAEEALRIYRFLLEKTRAAAIGVAAERHLWYSEAIAPDDGWPQELFVKKCQPPGDLGERMEYAFRTAFEGGAEKVVIMGSDCPELDHAILEQAFDALDSADFVIGPVPDGGYYLLGMKVMTPAVFQDIAWSTGSVRAHTQEKIAALQMTCKLLPGLTDIDEAADWNAYRSRAANV